MAPTHIKINSLYIYIWYSSIHSLPTLLYISHTYIYGGGIMPFNILHLTLIVPLLAIQNHLFLYLYHSRHWYYPIDFSSALCWMQDAFWRTFLQKFAFTPTSPGSTIHSIQPMSVLECCSQYALSPIEWKVLLGSASISHSFACECAGGAGSAEGDNTVPRQTDI